MVCFIYKTPAGKESGEIPKRQGYKGIHTKGIYKYINVAGQRRLVEAPLFRSYVFVHVEYKTPEYYLTLDAPGISTIIHKKEISLPIPDDEMLSLIKVVNKAREKNILEHLFLKIGQKVIVVEGPLKGAVGVIEQIDKSKTLFYVNIMIPKRSHLSASSS